MKKIRHTGNKIPRLIVYIDDNLCESEVLT